MVSHTGEETEVLLQINLIASSLSLIGSLFIMLLYWKALELRVYAFKLVFLLSIGDFIKCLTIILSSLPLPQVNILCQVEAFLLDISTLTTFTWYLAISHTLYKAIVHYPDNLEKHYHFWLFLAYIIIPLLQVPPFITQSYGEVETLCTLEQDTFGNLWRLICVYIPIWTHVALTVYYYGKMYLRIKTTKNSFLNSDDEKKMISKTIRYPIILLISSVPISLLRIFQTFTSWNIFWFEAISMALFDLQGLANALAYGWNESVRIYLRQLLLGKVYTQSTLNYLEQTK